MNLMLKWKSCILDIHLKAWGEHFKQIQLLVQTMSNTKQHVFHFVPISQNNKIQETVKIVYNYIKENQFTN